MLRQRQILVAGQEPAGGDEGVGVGEGVGEAVDQVRLGRYYRLYFACQPDCVCSWGCIWGWEKNGRRMGMRMGKGKRGHKGKTYPRRQKVPLDHAPPSRDEAGFVRENGVDEAQAFH